MHRWQFQLYIVLLHCCWRSCLNHSITSVCNQHWNISASVSPEDEACCELHVTWWAAPCPPLQPSGRSHSWPFPHTNTQIHSTCTHSCRPYVCWGSRVWGSVWSRGQRQGAAGDLLSAGVTTSQWPCAQISRVWNTRRHTCKQVLTRTELALCILYYSYTSGEKTYRSLSSRQSKRSLTSFSYFL